MSAHRRHARAWLIVPLVLLGLVPASLASASSWPGRAYLGHPFFHGSSLSSLTAVNDCTLRVPRNPLSPRGLATPYVLSSGNDGTVCSETDQGTAAFVQAVIYVPSSGALYTYNPVVEDAGQPLLGSAPPVPSLPRGAVVSIWTGFNDNVLKLTGPGSYQFTNFAQQGYDNSPQFFGAVWSGVFRGRVRVPALGTSPADGMACPSVRDFSVVDQDQSDNVPVTYDAYGTTNGSDDQLIDNIDQSLGCSQWLVPSLSQPGTSSTAGPLDEVQAAMFQSDPALVPGGDEFVTSNGEFLPPLGTGQPDLFFDDLYRADVGQPFTFNDHDTRAYCENLASVGAPRLKADAGIEAGFPAPVFAQIAPTLAGVLQARFEGTWANLDCTALTGQADPY